MLDVLRRPAFREGKWQLLECAPAWDGNGSSDAFVAFAWENADDPRVIVCVNYAADQSQCYVRLPFPDLDGSAWRLRDLLSDTQYDRDGDDLTVKGLYLDVPPWRYYIFEMRAN